MSLYEHVYKILAEAAADVVEGRPGEEAAVAPDLLLVGEGSPLDSLGLVSLIVTAETKIQEEFGVSIALVDGAVMDSQESKFKTLEKLAEHVTQLLRSEGLDDD